MDSFEKFNETSLPPKEAFYSKLTKSGITDEDYVHAKQVWGAFECENLGDYHDIYLATDAILLADVFENFRKTCLKNYGLDPAHYYTSPALSWDALLKHTGIQLELLTDYNKYLFIEKGTRGGVSTEMKRYCKANNPFLQDYNPRKRPPTSTTSTQTTSTAGHEPVSPNRQLLLAAQYADRGANQELAARQEKRLHP